MDDKRGDALPPGWAWARLGEIADVNPGIDLAALDPEAAYPFLPMAAVEALSNRVSLDLKRPFREVASGFTRFAAGDVLFAKITPCMENGKIATVPDVAGPAAFGTTEFHVFRPKQRIDARYVRYYLVQQQVRDRAKSAMSGAVGQQRVSAAFMRDLSMPIAPADEQRRIADCIDDLFTQLDEAEAAVGRARERAGAYRASLLHAACTGALTADWRAANPNPKEDGPALLRRILAERRAVWLRNEQARLLTRGLSEGKAKSISRYVEPRSPQDWQDDTLPPGWIWVSLQQLTNRITSGSRDWGKRYTDDGPALIRAQNIKTDTLATDDLARVQRPLGDAETRTKVRQGDLLVTITGANVTKAAHVTRDVGEAFVSQHVGLCRLVLPDIGSFIHLAVVTESIGRCQLRDAAYGAGKPGLNLEDLARLTLPLPPLEEQAEIMQTLRDSAEAWPPVDDLIHQPRQSILHAAFTGQLVPQDPADEPAAALLARLRIGAAPSPTARTRRTRQKATA